MQYGLGLRPHLSHSVPRSARTCQEGWLDGVINWNRGSGVRGKGMREAGAGLGGLGLGSARMPVVGEVCARSAQCEQGIGTGAGSARLAPQGCALCVLGMRECALRAREVR